MIFDTFISLIYNAALLLSVALVYDLIAYEESRVNVFTKIYTGLIVAVIALAIMINPWTMEPGVVFDTRTILFSLAAMFFGPLPAILSGTLAILYRVWMGGPGIYTGVTTIMSSILWGLLWRYLHQKKGWRYSGKELYSLGIINHLSMLILMLLLPVEIRWLVLRTISLPVIIIFPLGTVALGQLLARRIERQKEKRALKISELRYRQLSETTKDMIILHDSSGEIIYANRVALDFLGLESLEHKSANIYQYVLPSSIDKMKRHANEMLEGYSGLRIYTLQIMDFQGRNRLAEVSNSAMDAEGKTLILAAIRDVTDRIRTQEQKDNYANRLEILRELDSIVLETQSFEQVCGAAVEKLQRLIPFNVLTAMEVRGDKVRIVAMHKPETRYRYLSTQTDYPCDEDFCLDLKRKRNYVISHADTNTWENGKPINSALVQDGIASFMYNALLVGGELVGYLWFGSEKEAAFSLEHIEIGQEFANQLAIVMHHLDLIQKIKNHAQSMENQVLDRTRQLKEANDELESFSYSVAHDLRAPLKIITGFSEVLKDDFGDNLKQDAIDILSTIENTAKRMDVMIRDILELSRVNREDLHKESIDTSRMVAELVATVVPKDTFELQIDELPPCYGDPTLIRQVWQNLLDNAVKFTLSASRRSIHIGSFQDGSMLSFFVKDSGVGFDPAEESQIFAPFKRLHAKDKYEGTGIGLALVKKAILRHKGNIRVESKLNEGSTFTFSLPIQEEDTNETK